MNVGKLLIIAYLVVQKYCSVQWIRKKKFLSVVQTGSKLAVNVSLITHLTTP